MSEVADRVTRSAVDAVESLGLELVETQVKGSRNNRVVRLLVDRDGGVGVDDCQRASEAVSARLDEDDPVAGRYRLEVSSPGTDYPLRGRRAFERVRGRPVLVHWTVAEGEPPRQIEGEVGDVDDEAVWLDTGAGAERIPHADIAKAVQRLPW